MTKLQAVNRMLALVGEPPVATLEGVTIPEVLQAVEVLDAVSAEVQAVGWHFNSDDGLTLTPVEGVIEVPANATRLDATDASLDMVVRAGKLYDKTTHSHTFVDPVLVDVVWLFDFSDLPVVAQQYIALRASRRFLREHLGPTSGDTQLAQDEQMAFVRLVDADGSNADYNLLEGNPETLRASLREL